VRLTFDLPIQISEVRILSGTPRFSVVEEDLAIHIYRNDRRGIGRFRYNRVIHEG